MNAVIGQMMWLIGGSLFLLRLTCNSDDSGVEAPSQSEEKEFVMIRSVSLRALLLASSLVGGPVVAHAANAGADAGAEAGAEAGAPLVIVTGRAAGYKADDIATATKTDTPLIDVPQSVAVVTRARIEDQALHSMGEVLRYVPGATVGQGEGNRDQITLRGQGSSADFFLDGLRDDVQYFRSLYNIERVEVLKGPFALTFGRRGSGGVINRVQKVPHADGWKGSLNGSLNSLGARDVGLDVNAPISGNAAFRLNGFYEDLANHRDFFGGRRYAANPYLGVALGDWQLGLSYEYVNDQRKTDRGVPSVAVGAGQANRPVNGQRDTFIGVPAANDTGFEAHIAKLRLDGQLASHLKASTTLLYGDYDKYYGNVFANGVASSDNGTVALGSYRDATQRRNFIAQGNLVWDFTAGFSAHKVLAGAEYADQRTDSARNNGTLSAGTFNLAQPTLFPTVSWGAASRASYSKVEVFSAYLQDQISLGAHVDLVLGLRYDRFALNGVDKVGPPAGRLFARTDEKLSPRLGLVIKPQENMSLYASYSRSFLPRSGDQFLSLTVAQSNLEPENYTNYEIGAKWDIRKGLNATVALFQLDRSNATTPDPANVANTINIGTTRTKGAEVALAGRIAPHWQASVAYTYQDAALGGNGAVRLSQVPEHQFALWNRYEVTQKLGLGLGVVHQSSMFAAIRTAATTTQLPAFTRVDGGIFFKPHPRLQLQLNVENLFNVTYFPDAHNNNNISTGAPRNARLTARIGF